MYADRINFADYSPGGIVVKLKVNVESQNYLAILADVNGEKYGEK